MINRKNWLDVKAFVEFQQTINQVNPKTADVIYFRLVHLLEWAQETPFPKAMRIKPTFPAYVEGLRTTSGSLYSSGHLAGIFKTCRAFFVWARYEYAGRYKHVDLNWIKSLRASRGRSEQAELHKRELYTLDDVRRLVSVPAESLAERRLRAAVALLFLSGMRIGAFLTLPLECVDIQGRQIMQLPSKGVHTKNSKAAVTFLLNIPDLLEVVEEWDTFLRQKLPPEAYWYAHLDAWGELCEKQPIGDRAERRKDFRIALRGLCARAGVRYLSAHKFRHGHAVYALKQAKTPAQMKAISQNLMHSNMGITDGIYGRLVNDDVRDMIMGLGG
jgi:integrase